jgi:hypothetical protein
LAVCLLPDSGVETVQLAVDESSDATPYFETASNATEDMK